MRLVYITASLPFGPYEAFVLPELEELLRRGHEIVLVPRRRQGEVIHGDAAHLVAHVQGSALLSPAMLPAIARTLARHPLRALHALALLRSSRSSAILAKNLAVYPKSLWLARQLRRKSIDHVHVHWAGTSATLALLACHVARVSWSCTTHRWDIEEDNLLATKARRACFMRAISEQGADRLAERAGPGTRAPVVLHVGIRLGPPPRDHLPTADELRVLCAANLLPVKGHRHLIEAVAIARRRGVPVRLDLAGDGTERPALAKAVAEHGLEGAVTFLGVVPHPELLDRLRAGEWDAVALASVVTDDGAMEGIPVILIESMACGLPVVSTRTGGIPELLGRGAGLLVEQRDAGALAEALARLAADAVGRVELGRAGRELVEREYAIERVVDELERRFGDCGLSAR